MQQTLRCSACNGRSFWRVNPVRERGPVVAQMPIAFDAGGVGRGHFELILCRQCGHAEWYAHDVERVRMGTNVRPASAGGLPCRGCGAATFLDVAMLEAVLGRQGAWVHLPVAAVPGVDPPENAAARGDMTIRICEGCGHVEWFSAQPDRLDAKGILETFERRCDRCDGTSATRLRARERNLDASDVVDRPVAIRVALSGWRPLGGFEMLVCRGCGQTEWIAVGLEELDEDEAAGVSRIEGGAPEVPSGPYR
jgi:predicted nucleic-acid-binding Zn-ribbon protein